MTGAIRFSGWRFRQGLVSSIAAAALVALTVSLGDWERPDAGVDRNRGYALQWYSFALLAAILYAVLNFKRIHPDNG
jgi:hypothetical protein